MSYSSCRKKIVKTCVPSNESIYNLLPKVEQEVSKLPLYRSIYSSKVLEDLKNKKHDRKTFGVAELCLKPPQEFLKRQERNARITLEDTKKSAVVLPAITKKREKKERLLKKLMSFKSKDSSKSPRRGGVRDDVMCPNNPAYTCLDEMRDKIKPRVQTQITNVEKLSCDPNVNLKSQAPILRFERFKKPDKKQQSTHNYIKENVKSVLKAQPKTISQRMLVFTKKGDKFSFCDSGMDAHYSRCLEFGKVPCYVQRRKKELQDARDEYDKKVSDKIGACAMKKLTAEERETLMCNLHESHKKLFDQYNKLPLVITSLTLKNFKIKLEVQLAQLEKDIKLLTAHSEIYVAD